MKSSGNDTIGIIKPSQVRAARGLLGWTLDDLIAASGVPKSTLIRFENAAVSPRTSTVNAIRAALVVAGVEFIEENGGGAGVRLRKPG
jgi:transcriptional regulator with XRE-family HTH domain